MATNDKVRSTRLSSKSKPTDTLSFCAFCERTILGTQCIQCDTCNQWACLECSKLPKTLFLEINKAEDADIDWSCRICKHSKPNLHKISSTLTELKTSNEKRLTKVESRLAQIEDTFKESVKKEVENATIVLATNLNKNIAETVEKLVEAKVKELEDRKVRSHNLIIFKLAVSKDSSPAVRKQFDTDMLKKLFSELCPSKGELDIKTCFRLKNKSKPSDTPPLKVIFNSQEQRRALLMNSQNITKLPDEKMKVLKVAKDRTKEQQEAQRAIANERQRRKNEGEEVTVRFGVVIEVNRQREDSFCE